MLVYILPHWEDERVQTRTSAKEHSDHVKVYYLNKGCTFSHCTVCMQVNRPYMPVVIKCPQKHLEQWFAVDGGGCALSSAPRCMGFLEQRQIFLSLFFSIKQIIFRTHCTRRSSSKIYLEHREWYKFTTFPGRLPRWVQGFLRLIQLWNIPEAYH